MSNQSDKHEMQNKWSKWIFTGSIFLVILTMILANQVGSKQDEKYLADYQVYMNAQASLQSNDTDQALENLKLLLNKPEYKNSASINWFVAQIYVYQGNITQGIVYYDRLKGIYPAIVLNNQFLKDYGETLSLAHDKRAEIYLSRVK